MVGESLIVFKEVAFGAWRSGPPQRERTGMQVYERDAVSTDRGIEKEREEKIWVG